MSTHGHCRVVLSPASGPDIIGTLIVANLESVKFEFYHEPGRVAPPKILESLKIDLFGKIVYSGKGLLVNMMDLGTKLIIEAKLDQIGWVGLGRLDRERLPEELVTQFNGFIKDWQNDYKISADFKLAVTDLQTFFIRLQLWLNELELKTEILDERSKDNFQIEIIKQLEQPLSGAIDTMIERMESIVGREQVQVGQGYHDYLREHLHPLLLCSPFARRAFTKPLGYAGDHIMVSMMLDKSYEGNSLFAKAVNAWLLGQAPAEAHRNRVDYLQRKLNAIAMKAKEGGRIARIYSLGCGPAGEVQRFLANSQLAKHTEFTLVDFNEETLESLRQKLKLIGQKVKGPISYKLVKRSVNEILKGRNRLAPGRGEAEYDYIYCAGLFDYLQDSVCKQMMEIFYRMLAPGGLMLVTNATDRLNEVRPFRYSMELILDWYLIYRDARQFSGFVPAEVDANCVKVIAENVGANIFLEVEKSENVRTAR